MKSLLKTVIADERGVSAVEYGLLAALIAMIIVTAATAAGQKMQAVYEMVAGKL